MFHTRANAGPARYQSVLSIQWKKIGLYSWWLHLATVKMRCVSVEPYSSTASNPATIVSI